MESTLNGLNESVLILIPQRRGLERWIFKLIIWKSLRNKVNLDAYYKKIKVFDLACMQTCCWGLSKPNYEAFK